MLQFAGQPCILVFHAQSDPAAEKVMVTAQSSAHTGSFAFLRGNF